MLQKLSTHTRRRQYFRGAHSMIPRKRLVPYWYAMCIHPRKRRRKRCRAGCQIGRPRREGLTQKRILERCSRDGGARGPDVASSTSRCIFCCGRSASSEIDKNIQASLSYYLTILLATGVTKVYRTSLDMHTWCVGFASIRSPDMCECTAVDWLVGCSAPGYVSCFAKTFAIQTARIPLKHLRCAYAVEQQINEKSVTKF